MIFELLDLMPRSLYLISIPDYDNPTMNFPGKKKKKSYILKHSKGFVKLSPLTSKTSFPLLEPTKTVYIIIPKTIRPRIFPIITRLLRLLLS
jgi:hypothetical protein